MKENNRVNASLTALSVMSSYIQSINKPLIPSEFYIELCLAQHIISSVVDFESYGCSYGDENSLKKLLHYLQHNFFNKTVTPGYHSMILARKLMLKHKVEMGILSNGVRQVIFLGGGYDVRAFISSIKFPNVQFYELDRGQTRQIKLKALLNIPKEIGIRQTPVDIRINHTHIFNENFFCVDCDFLEDNLEEVLCANGFKKGSKTLVIAEGLTMYLNEKGVMQLLAGLANLLEEHDEFILSFIPKIINSFSEDMPIESRELHCFSLPPDEVSRFVTAYGFEVIHKNLFKDLLMLMGDINNAKKHENNLILKQEHYYTLRKCTHLLKASSKTIHEIPDYQFSIPFNCCA
ncbi:TPA: class I SAM-dependent methyltransferase [Legionella pneumophila]|nr:class I SAM-dependent methyltransferase [Legionella pneumophila]MCK1857725.1 class I SAM-dependent methyltransferase [Legionella pneumophila]MCZ4686904.1 class I SAM-dependent methyltransferase [Legionella pneumophila]MDW9007237.1 class I SAM-dependent methyltransferase [Legionella pneumophila]UKW27030.1 class I SAM-dependent methyltransferase [Legionella pneumophila]